MCRLLLEKEKISREEFEALFHDEPVEAIGTGGKDDEHE